MILTATPAPALDRTVHVEALRLGESLRVDPAVVRPGGKGLNVARVLASQGHAVRALSTRGGADGERLATAPQLDGVEMRWVLTHAPTRTSTAWVEASGRTTVLNERAGAWSEAEGERWLAALDDAAQGVSAATISGSWPEGTPVELVGRSIETLVRAGVYTIADTSGPLLLAAAAAGASLLKPNIDELREATGLADPLAGVALLLELGAGSVLLSRGEEGMSHHTPEDPGGRSARLDVVLSGNPTGAGDAGVAGWLSVVGPLGCPPEGAQRDAALRAAVAWSASAVLAPVAGAITPEAEGFLDRVLLV